MSILLMDFGNTNIKIAISNLKSEKISEIKTFKSLKTFYGYYRKTIIKNELSDIVYCSVRGEKTKIIEKNIQQINVKIVESKGKNGKINMKRIFYNKNSGFSFLYNPIDSYGEDRLALLYYISIKYPNSPVFAIDSGTALTIDTMYNLHYEGGAIFPGINLSTKSLFSKTVQLPLIKNKEYSQPDLINKIKKEIFGFSTIDCILSGLYNSFTGFIIHSYNLFCEKLMKKYNYKNLNPVILITGGDSHLIYDLIKDKLNKNNIDIAIEENAIFLGLKFFYEKLF